MMHKGYVIEDAMPRLHKAAMDNDHSLLRRTLQQGCDVNVYWEGEMALHVACRLGNDDIVAILIDHGACVTAPLMYRHLMPLSVAIENGNISTAKLLVDKGKCLEGQSGQDCAFEALKECATHNQSEIHSYILNQGCFMLNRIELVKWTPLTSAVNRGHFKMVKALLEAGADPNYPKHFWPLHLAIYRRHPKIAQLLISYGANVNSFNGRLGCYLLHHAVRTAATEIVMMLLHAKCDINKLQPDGKTALYLAAELGFSEILDELLQAGADPNINRPDTGDSPLAAAMDLPAEVHYINPNKPITNLVWLLIKAGANVDQKNSMGQSPLQTAIGRKYNIVADMLLKADCQVQSSDITKAYVINESLKSKCNEDSLVIESLRAALIQPAKLSNFCRKSVRTAIYGWPYHRAIASLPIPAVLKDFLLFKSIQPLLETS